MFVLAKKYDKTISADDLTTEDLYRERRSNVISGMQRGHVKKLKMRLLL